MADNLPGRAFRFPGGHTAGDPVPVQRAQQGPDPGIYPVLKLAHPDIPLPVDFHRAHRFLLGHAHIGAEGKGQGRSHKPAECFRVRLGPAHLLRRVLHALPDAFLRLRQCPVQVKNHIFTHRIRSPSTPNRCSSEVCRSTSSTSPVSSSPGTTSGTPGG